ncbi:hypothetical protein M885DRAFT_566242 [Pelagophyceae sp. CCMP2097]|nr:hypothetical protein M885DRAFT_566242 [Pelagophyceae sp. CCMP2097]
MDSDDGPLGPVLQYAFQAQLCLRDAAALARTSKKWRNRTPPAPNDEGNVLAWAWRRRSRRGARGVAKAWSVQTLFSFVGGASSERFVVSATDSAKRHVRRRMELVGPLAAVALFAAVSLRPTYVRSATDAPGTLEAPRLAVCLRLAATVKRTDKFASLRLASVWLARERYSERICFVHASTEVYVGLILHPAARHETRWIVSYTAAELEASPRAVELWWRQAQTLQQPRDVLIHDDCWGEYLRIFASEVLSERIDAWFDTFLPGVLWRNSRVNSWQPFDEME